MGRATDSAVLRGLRTVFDGGSAAGLADGPLLEQFARRGAGDSAGSAFAVLVERHGPMVWRVCRATLRDEHEAEDAFQAVFLVLARKARSLWVRDSLGPWLHAVALRTAAFARSEAKRRLDLHRRRAEAIVPRSEEPPRDDPSPVIHEELDKLPDRYRAAVVLCDLEGLSHEEAALQLGWPIGTVKSRQSRGRARLRERLTRRGLGPPAGALILPTAPAIPPALGPTTVDAAASLLRGGVAAGPPSALVLMKGVLATMWLQRLPAVAALAVTASVLVPMAALTAHALARPDDPPAKPAAAPAKPAARPIRDVLRDAARAAAPDGDTKDAAFLLLQIAKAQAHAGDKGGALETARRVSKAIEGMSPEAAPRMLIELAYVRDAAGDRAGGLSDLDRADGLVHSPSGAIETPIGPNQFDWFPARRLIAEARFDLGDVKAAEATVRALADGIASLPRDKDSTHPSQELAAAQVYVGDVDGAFRTVEKAYSPPNRPDNGNKGGALGNLAGAASSATHWALQPRKVFSPEQREARRPILDRIEVIVGGFEFADERPDGELAIAWANLGDFDAALRAAHRVGAGPVRFANGSDPSGLVYTLSVIGGMQGKAGRKEEAATTLREALDLVKNHPEFASRLPQIAANQLAAGDEAEALKTMDAADPKGRPQWLAGLARQRAEAGDRDGARALLLRALHEAEGLLELPAPPPTRIEEEMKARNPLSKPVDREVAHKDAILAEIATIHARLGHLDAATTFLRKITPEAWQFRFTAQNIARALVESGDPAGALDWAMTLDPALRTEALRGLAEGVVGR